MRAHRLALFVVLAACGTQARFLPLNPPPHRLTPRAPETVEFHASGPPSRPFVDIGVIETLQESGATPLEDVLARLRVEAGRLGCDGVVFLGGNDQVVAVDSVSTLRGYRASCIVY